MDDPTWTPIGCEATCTRSDGGHSFWVLDQPISRLIIEPSPGARRPRAFPQYQIFGESWSAGDAILLTLILDGVDAGKWAGEFPKGAGGVLVLDAASELAPYGIAGNLRPADHEEKVAKARLEVAQIDEQIGEKRRERARLNLDMDDEILQCIDTRRQLIEDHRL